MKRAPLAGLILCVAPGLLPRSYAPACAAAISPERQREILREALNASEQAIELARNEPTRAQELYRRAAAGFQALVDAGVENSALEYNLGNAHLRLGQLGQAILHYRRAERLDPGHPKLRANLAYARRQVEPAIVPSGQDRLVRRLLFWHYDTSLRGRFRAVAALSMLGWGLLTARLRWKARPLLVSAIGFIVLALVTAGSLAWQIRDESQHPPAVLVAENQILRLGRGAAYEPALKQPLGPGIELRILQRRGDWVEVRLPNDQAGWLPAAAVEPV